MSDKENWNKLAHEKRMHLLRDSSIDNLIATYQAPGLNEQQFREHLQQEASLWDVKNISEFQFMGEPPNKEMILGAWRDLDKTEALLELIDNSIDAWLRRKSNTPDAAHKELSIYIDIDPTSGQMIYEDNAGGVSEDKLINLVIPGYSETKFDDISIGSYKTGGKKSIFRLSEAVRITTRYLDPKNKTDEAISVHLDEEWISDQDKYKFAYTKIDDIGSIPKGTTRFAMKLRIMSRGTPWYENPEEVKRIKESIELTYSLLIAREKNINIYFMNRKEPISGNLDEIYEFSGTNNSDADIRPQITTFNFSLNHAGISFPIKLEILMGCRVTSGSHDGKTWGIDLYGNNRLFISHDQRIFKDILPAGTAKGFVRGYINIIAPNIFIPWDTHKRHLNLDRDIIDIIKTHKLIRDFIGNWSEAYKAISRGVRGDIKKVLGTPCSIVSKRPGGSLAISHQKEVDLPLDRKRGIYLPEDFFIPRVSLGSKEDNDIKLNISLSKNEARLLTSYYGISGDVVSRKVKNDLTNALKEDILKRASRGKK